MRVTASMRSSRETSGSSDSVNSRLVELCERVVDCPHSTPVWTEDGPIVLRSHNIRRGRLLLGDVSHTDERHFAERIRRATPEGGDLVITREAPMGEVAMIPSGLRCCLGQRMVLLRPDRKRVDPRFLLYALQSPAVQHQIRAHDGSGSTVSNLRIPLLEQLVIETPGLRDQTRIGEILGALDDKIELNRRMVEALSSAVAEVYGQVATMAPGDAAIGEVAEVIDCLHSKKPERRDIGRPLLQLYNIRDDGLLDMADPYLIDECDYILWISRIEAAQGDCVITNVGRVGAVAQIPSGFRAALGRNMTAVRCRGDFPYPTYLLQALLSDDMREEIALRTDTGTILDALNVRSIPRLRMPLPGRSDLVRFERMVRPVRARMERTLAESRTLGAIRDTLLPRLLSGELEVAV
jgi:type I restriction enzyme S subunit